MATLLRTACPSSLLPLLLLLAVPAVAQAQFAYSVNNGAVTITGYTGPGGAVVIPSEVNSLPVSGIGDWAFFCCTSLTGVTIPNSVTSIGVYAFGGCTSLTNVAIANSVTNIEDFAFSHCTSLTKVTIPGNIAYGAFYDCTSLVSVTVGSTVSSIGEDAFYGCASLSAIMVDTLNSAYTSVSGVLFNKSQTTLIEYPPGKTGTYTIPRGVTSIGNDGFYYCTSLTSVTIPSSVTSIGSGAFASCTSLASAAIGSGVTSIGNDAFYYCTSLRTVTIPDSVTSIGNDAFASCTSLASAAIGSGVTSIGSQWVFASCTNLASVYFRGNCPTGIITISIDTNATPPFTNITDTLSGLFSGDNYATVYYLPGTTGWRPFFANRPAVLWSPQVLAAGPSFGVRTNRFGFTITATSALIVVVEASADLANPSWSTLATNTLTRGSFYFSDPQWTNYPSRFYRLRWP